MKNLTVSVASDVLEWARVRAARRGVSMSRMLSDMLRETMDRERQYQRAMARYLARSPVNLGDGSPYPTREAIYDRAVLR